MSTTLDPRLPSDTPVSFVHRGITFTARTTRDQDHGAPWEESDNHGIVTDWISQSEQYDFPDLYQDRTKFYPLGDPERDGSRRFYDMQASIRKALKDHWGLSPAALQDLQNEWEAGTVLTPEVQTHRAVVLDRDFLNSWCNDEWEYIGVIVMLPGTNLQGSLWGIESNAGAYLADVAHNLAEELINDRASVAQLETTIYRLREQQEQLMSARDEIQDGKQP